MRNQVYWRPLLPIYTLQLAKTVWNEGEMADQWWRTFRNVELEQKCPDVPWKRLKNGRERCDDLLPLPAVQMFTQIPTKFAFQAQTVLNIFVVLLISFHGGINFFDPLCNLLHNKSNNKCSSINVENYIKYGDFIFQYGQWVTFLVWTWNCSIVCVKNTKTCKFTQFSCNFIPYLILMQSFFTS